LNRDPSLNNDGLLESLCATITTLESPAFAQYRGLEPLANRHFVRALLRDRLLTHEVQRGGALTADLRALNDLALREAALETRRNVTLVRIIEALSAAGVPSLVFKGSALAHSLYPKPELRERDDTDLAVIHSHLQVADRVLGRLDFKAIAGNEGSLIMRQRLYRHRDADGLLHNIDLHWAISNSPRTNQLNVRDLLARSRELAALGTHARMPSVTDNFLIACAHLDAHHVHDVRLVWLYDLHLMIAQMPVGIRAHASRQAIEYELGGACAWVLTLLEQTLGTSLIGFEALLANADARRPGASRVSQWQRELRALPDNRTRTRWLWQHMFPAPRFVRDSQHPNTSLWRLYLARLLRGAAHLSR
jgi:hypothetical protein